MLCSICKHLKAVYLWASALISGGAGKSLVALKWGVGCMCVWGGWTVCVLKALCLESQTCTLCIGKPHSGLWFVYIRETDHFDSCNGRLAEGQLACLFTENRSTHKVL